MVEAAVQKAKTLCMEFIEKSNTREMTIEDLMPVLKAASAVLAAMNLRSGLRGGDALAMEVWKGHRNPHSGIEQQVKVALMANGDLVLEQLITDARGQVGIAAPPKRVQVEVLFKIGAKGKDLVENVLRSIDDPDNFWPPFTPEGKN